MLQLEFNFINKFIKIIIMTLVSTFIFYYLVGFFGDNLSYDSNNKLITMILLVIITSIIYILLSIITKTFKISDIKLRY